MFTLHRSKKDSQQGIALIMVLGFLAVLSILAVSFAITMRTERLASSVYVDGVKARQLLYVAMTRAVDEIDYELVTSGNVMPSAAQEKLVKSLGAAGSPTVESEGKSLYSDDVLNYIPLNALPAAVNLIDAAEWVTIQDPDGNPAGRIAFAAFDMSGLVDINRVVDQFNETNLHAAAFSALPDAPEIASFSTITSEWVRFESTGEIDQSGILSGGFPRNFAVYSRFETNNIDAFNIQGDENYLQANQAIILARFGDAGIPAAVHNELFNNLIDYVDSDDVPQDVNSCCTEAVPMINEIIFENECVVKVGPSTLSQTLKMTIETFYPFPARPMDTRSFNVRVNTLQFAAPTGPALALPAILPTPFSLTPFAVPLGYSYETVANTITLGTTVDVPLAPFPPAKTMDLKVAAFSADIVDQNGTIVDSVTLTPPFGTDPWVQGSPIVIRNGVALREVTSAHAACTDPRMNHDPALGWASPPAGPTTSKGSLNGNSTANEGYSPMFVRNGPISNVAELGFLSLGTGPWETVSLYDDGGTLHRVLDYFVVSNTVPRGGCINMNSSEPAIIGSLLNDCAIQLYPGEDPPSGGTVTEAQGDGFGNAFVGLPGQGQFQRSSVIGDGNWFQTAFATDAEREMIIHNRHDLFRWRQNLYAVIIAAQSGKDRNSDGDIEESEVTGEARAFFILWRDPIAQDHPSPDIEPPDLVNRSFIRFFRYLY